MEAKEIFEAVLKSPRLKELLGLSPDEELNESYDKTSKFKEIEAIKLIIQGQMRHLSFGAVSQNLSRILAE
ncbi:MAG: hypothetical protein MJZ32_07075 [Bacteroidaceae bacterium]|nr:hypothetical protein [Bacteroidaceae bacterium]